jgi:hypothetical protein
MTELAYEDIKVGDEASLTRTITEVHIVNYAGLTGTGTRFTPTPNTPRSRCSASGLRTACSWRG